MDLSIWLPTVLGLGLLTLGLMAAFVYFCDRV